jgi:hypothetical protein
MADPSASPHLPPAHAAHHQRSHSLSVGSSNTPATANPQDIVNQMSARIMQLEQQVAQAAVAKVPYVKKPAIPTPKPFTGEVTGTSTHTIDDWIDDVEKQLRHHNTYFTTEAIVIDWASTYLSGKASAWWKSTKEERQASEEQITTWEGMKAELRERFQPIEAATVARINLDKMTQKGTVQSYTEYFYKQMMYIKDMSIADQLHCYTRGLKMNIRAELIKRKPTTIHEAVNIANTAESWTNMTSSQPKYTSRYQGSSSSSSSSSSGVPMELGNVNQIIQQLNEDGNSVQGDEQAASSAASIGGNYNTPMYTREQVLNMMQEVQRQRQFSHSLNALFGNGNKNNNNNNRSRSSGDRTRVPGVSREDYERCRTEGLCINCKKPGHVAKDCKGQNLKF